MIPEGSRGVGGRLCPWSRCLTFAKPAKHPSPTPVRGEVRGVGQERGVRQGGQKTAGQGRSAGATCPQKQTTVTHFHSEDHLLVCPSPLPSARPLFLFSQYASMKPRYIPSHTSPSTPHSICPFGLPVCLIIKPLLPSLPLLLSGR